MSADWDDEPLGYKRPPIWSRFQKGRSGNPRGRPRKQKPVASAPDPASTSTLDNALRMERDRRVKVNDGGASKDLAIFEVVLRSLANSAATGNVHAQKLFLPMLEKLEVRDAERESGEKERELRTFKNIVSLKERQAKKWADAERAGTEPRDDPWPHPDDIIVNHGTLKWRIAGPYNAADLPRFDYFRAERDAMLLRWVIECRTRKLSEAGKASVYDLWMLWDLQIPKRWRIIDRFEAEIAVLLFRPLRDLRAHLKECEARALRLRPSSLNDPMDKETYRTVNEAMKPLLKLYGYRSLAEFDKAHEQFGEAMPWPKRKITAG